MGEREAREGGATGREEAATEEEGRVSELGSHLHAISTSMSEYTASAVAA